MTSYSIDTLPGPLRDRRIVSARLDVFDLDWDPAVYDDDDDVSMNHWAWSFAFADGHSVRFSMESTRNLETGRYGSLEIRQVSYRGLAHSVVKSVEFDTATITIGHVADMILLYKLDDFELREDRYGNCKGCRHWCHKLGEFLEMHKWMNDISTSNERVEMILPFVYTPREGSGEVWAKSARVEEGVFH